MQVPNPLKRRDPFPMLIISPSYLIYVVSLKQAARTLSAQLSRILYMLLTSSGADSRVKLTVKFDVLPHDGALGLVILVYGDLDLAAIDVPSAHTSHELFELLP